VGIAPAGLKVLGLTGGIGSGKSEVARVLRSVGIPVIDADDVARAQMRRGTPVFDAVIAEFGPAVVGADGEVDRRALAGRAFADPATLARLNALTHGPVMAEVGRRLAVLREAGQMVAVVEAALIVEGGLDRALDGLIVVTAPEEARVRRVAARDGVAEAEVRARCAAQASDEDRAARATLVVRNDGSLDDLRGRALRVAMEVARHAGASGGTNAEP